MREIIFDTETTGLDPQKGDRMVEIGCIELVNRVPTGAVFHAYFNPERDMPAEAEAVHGLSAAFLSDKPRFAERAAELGQIGLAPVCHSRMIDPVKLARVRHPVAKLSLDALCTRYGIDRSHRTRHGALLDAELLAQVYVELTGGRQIGLELAGGPVDAIDAAMAAPPRERVFRPARPHTASEAELAAHAAFLETVKAPLWLGGT